MGNLPRLRFPEFLGVGEWEEKTLEKLCVNISSGKDKNDKGGIYDLYGSTGVIGKTFNNTFTGDLILVARVGANAGLLNRASGTFGVTDNTLVVFLKKDENIDYTYYSLDKFGLNKLVFGSGQPLITGKQLKNLKIGSPSPKEQQKIANCLTSLDQLITAHAQKLDTLKTHKKGLMQQLFPAKGKTVPNYRFPEFRDAGDWEEYSIAQLIKQNFLFPPKDGNHGNLHPKSSDYVETGIPFVMANDLKDGAIDFSKCTYINKNLADNLQKGFAKEGDVLLTHKGTVGEVALVRNIKFPYLMLTPQVTYYRIKNKSRLSNEFLGMLFLSHSFQELLKIVSGGGTRAYIGITEQAKLRINIPIKISEQQKIANCLASLDQLITAQTEKIKQLKAHKKGLMQQLFPSIDDKSRDIKEEVGT